MKKAKKKVRICGRILFVVYLLLALYAMFFSESLDRTSVSTQYRYNLIPFAEIERFWNMRYAYGWHITLVNLLGNVVCFLPFGFLIPTLSKNNVLNNFLSVTMLAMAFSMLIETTQLITKVGAFDVDDIILNTFGGLLGYIIFKMAKGMVINKR